MAHPRHRLATCAATAGWVYLACLSPEGPSAQSAGPAYEVISIKIHKNPAAPRTDRMMPDGGFTMTNMPVVRLVTQAFTDARADMFGLPQWAFSTSVDVLAKAAPGQGPVTAAQRQAMTRDLLVSRFNMAWHREMREVEVYELVHARADRRLGRGLSRSATDCEAIFAQRRAEMEAAIAKGQPPPRPVIAPPTGPMPPCTSRQDTNGFEGEIPISALPPILRGFAGRTVIDRTGLSGSYRIVFAAVPAVLGTPGEATPPGGLPSVFTAVREQLGLKLEPGRAPVPAIVIDRLELPSEN